ncbi:MAG: hypothetical protein KCHDKBKB_02179 [Elusimicrobia bacterium]|nr:hypothetical protein [Elusimicrobiota bacterium]
MALMPLLFIAMPLSADDFSNNFSIVNQTNLDALTKDFGAAVGAGSFHNGKSLGFPLGFDVGVHVAAVGVKDENAILKDDGSSLLSKWAQVEVGLPARINVIGRYGQIEDADVIGGGLRIGLFTPSVPGLPAVSLTALYNQASHDLFDANTLSANAVLSFDIPFIHPYIGAGYDVTELELTDDPIVPVGARNLDSSESGYRVEAGINISLIPFTYLNLGAGLANGEELYHGGFGVKF